MVNWSKSKIEAKSWENLTNSGDSEPRRSRSGCWKGGGVRRGDCGSSWFMNHPLHPPSSSPSSVSRPWV